MKVLITGARGFIGSHLSAQLAIDDHDVYGTDRQDWDLAAPGAVTELIEDVEPDYIFHLAARYGRILCREKPYAAVCDNAAVTTELAAAAAKTRAHVLYASSSEVYGDQGEDTITEDSPLRRPTTIYGLSKLWGEQALRLYLPRERLTIARLNMLYGPEQRAGHGCCALATFIRDALDGLPIKVHARTSRSWLHIDDAVRALLVLMERPGIWNVGNSHDQRSMIEVAEVVANQIHGAALEIVEAPPDQIRHKNYSTDKLEHATGWTPTIDLEMGVADVIGWAARAGTVMRDYAEAA